MTNAPLPKDRDPMDQDQFLTILSREDALARFEGRPVSAIGSKASGGSLRMRSGGTLAQDIVAPDRRARRSTAPMWRLRGALRRYRLGQRSQAGPRQAERRSHRLRHTAPTRPVLSGTATSIATAWSAAARRRRPVVMVEHTQPVVPARSRSAAPPRRANSCPMPAPTIGTRRGAVT